MSIRPFHIAFPVRDLQETKKFYTEILGCKVGRADVSWIDFDLFGHQLSAHLKPSETRKVEGSYVDGKNVPVLHWGIILEMEQWEKLADKLRSHNIKFIIEPYIRFKGQIGEQATLFFLDPSGNALEFKAFRNDASIFAI